jgi:hypothetical protein
MVRPMFLGSAWPLLPQSFRKKPFLGKLVSRLCWCWRMALPLPAGPLGQPGTAVGEVVFNTGMTGYQEVMTDP